MCIKMQKRVLCKLYKIRKRFLTNPFKTMRKTTLLRIDTGISQQKPAFQGLKPRIVMYSVIHFLKRLAYRAQLVKVEGYNGHPARAA